MPEMVNVHRRYTEEDIERGLTEMILAGGNYRKAAEKLRERGYDFPPDTLYSWKAQTHAQRYEDLRARLVPRIQERIAAEAEDLAHHYAEVERKTLEAFDPSELSPKDAAGAIRNLATAKAINVDKSQLLRGNPTQIVEKRSATDILRELTRGAYDVEGTAEEVAVPAAIPAEQSH